MSRYFTKYCNCICQNLINSTYDLKPNFLFLTCHLFKLSLKITNLTASNILYTGTEPFLIILLPLLAAFLLGSQLDRIILDQCFNCGLNGIWKYGSGFFFLWSSKTSCGVQCDFRLFSYSQWIRFAELRGCLFIDNPFHKSQQSSHSLRGPQSLEAFWRKREGKCWRFCFRFGFNTQKVYNNVLVRLLCKTMYPFLSVYW